MSQTKAQLLDGKSATIQFTGGSASAPSVSFTGDTNTGIYSPGADQVAISTNGTQRVAFGTSEVVFNDDGNNYDFRIEGDTVSNLFFVDASADKVGIGTSAPDERLTLGAAGKLKLNRSDNATGATIHNGGGLEGLIFNELNSEGYKFQNNGTTALRIDSLNRVGIGTTSPGYLLDVAGSARIKTGATGTPFIVSTGSDSQGTLRFGSASNEYSISSGADYLGMIFNVNAGEAARIDSSGRLLVGTSTSRSNWYNSTNLDNNLQIEGTTHGGSGLSLVRNQSSNPPHVEFGTSGGTSLGSYTLVSSSAGLGTLSFQGADGTQFVEAASIGAQVDGTPGADDMPGRLVFSTTADGASSPTERLYLYSNGNVRAPGIYALTTAVAADVRVDADGYLYRSTSSVRYKTDVETLQDKYADAILNARPVWFRSLSEKDNPDWGYWGFIAEEVEQIDPRLCTYSTNEDGEQQVESVQYDRFVPHLLNLIKRQQQAIETLEAKVAALETP